VVHSDEVLVRSAAELRLALRRFLRGSEKALLEVGLTDRQYVLLLLVAAAQSDDEATITVLADRLLLASNTVSELADRAARLGLVRRVTDAGDRRVVRLTLTLKGKRLLLRAVRSLESERRELAKTLAAVPTTPAGRSSAARG
jgi:DNA-binding MarR family transcriptional regulator